MANDRFNFTRAKLRALPSPESGWRYFYDDGVRGLALGVGAGGAKSFRVNRKFKRRAIKVTLGVFDPEMPETRELPAGAKILDFLGNRAALNVRMARKLAMSVMTQLDTGFNPADRVREERHGMTLGELFAEYRSSLSAEGKKTVPEIARAFERYLGELPVEPRKKHGQERIKPTGSVNWQRRPLSAISQHEVSRLRLSLAQNVGRITANRVMELLRAIYNFAKNHKPPLYSGENPAAKIGKFDEPERDRFLESHEATGFFETLFSETDHDFRDYVLLSILAGARRGNLLRMRWDELSLDGATWRVSGEKMKNNKPLVIPLVQEAVEILRRRSETAESEWVFPGGTPSGHMGSPRKKWAKFLKRAGVADLHLHDLRRTLGSWMITMGASTVVTMRALGHRSMDASLRYQKLETAPARDAMQRGVSGLFQAANAGKGQVIELSPQNRTRKPSRAAR